MVRKTMTSGLRPPGTFISSHKLHMCSMQYEQRLMDLTMFDLKLGSVAGPIIQANGRLTFEDDLRSGGLLYFTTQ